MRRHVCAAFSEVTIQNPIYESQKTFTSDGINERKFEMFDRK